MTCGGCYHAQVMAGGESQLSVVIANQGLSDFSEDGKRESPAIARPVTKYILRRSLGVPFGSATAESLRNLPESSLFCSGYSVFKEPAPYPELNYYRVRRRKNISFHTP